MEREFDFKVSEEDSGVAYLYFAKEEPRTLSSKTVAIRDIIADYKGPDLYFDFDKEGELIGIEFLL